MEGPVLIMFYKNKNIYIYILDVYIYSNKCKGNEMNEKI